MSKLTPERLIVILAIVLLCIAVVGYAYKSNNSPTVESDTVTVVSSSTTEITATSSELTSASAEELRTAVREPEIFEVPVAEEVPRTERAEELEIIVPEAREIVVEPEPAQAPDSTAVGVTVAHQNILIASHNAARSQKGLAPLTWSSSVAASAQAWADNLGSRGCVLEHSNTSYGENLAFSWTTRDLVLNPVQAVTWWVAEEQYYNYETNTCAASEQCGHYTQVVWADTTQIGCGVSVCSEDGRNTQMWVCQYSPAGNDGSQPY